MMAGRPFIIQKVKNGKLLAENIQASLGEAIDRENHRVAKTINNIYIVENVQIPLALVECGFLSNPEESGLLQQDEYQNRLAWGIFIGISNYFNL